VCCDDLGYGDLGCYGAEYATPNIDALAERGLRFTDWHSNAPVCSPSRASLLTGCYPHRVDVPRNAPQDRPEQIAERGLSPDHPTIADLLGAAGYTTGAFGKWHLGSSTEDDPLACGFEEFFGFLSGCVDYYSHLMMWQQANGVPPYHDLWEDRTEVWHNGRYLTDLITERAVNFLDERANEDPFFAYVAYNAPHYPLHAPTTYHERVTIDDPERARHAAMVAGIDEGIGRMIDTLEQAGVRDETCVVFTSDHGPSREIRNHLDGSREPYHGGSTGGFRGEKFSLFEGGIRVPAIVSPPGSSNGDRAGEPPCEEFVCSMDVLPTILSYADVDPPTPCDGENFRHLVDGGDTTPHDQVFWEYSGQYAAREGDWKLVSDPETADSEPPSDDRSPLEEWLLFNLGEDPAESMDRSSDYPDRTRALADSVRQWSDRIGVESPPSA
jgi:arylsulfatase A-like enzyme